MTIYQLLDHYLHLRFRLWNRTGKLKWEDNPFWVYENMLDLKTTKITKFKTKFEAQDFIEKSKTLLQAEIIKELENADIRSRS